MITDSEKLACAQRELKMRKSAYPRWVNDRRMSASEAAHEIACIEAIIADYTEAAKKERLL